MKRIAGSLWSSPSDQARKHLELAVAAGLKYVHWDVTDGVFAKAGGFDSIRAKELSQGLNLIHEVHLMVNDPDSYIEEWGSFVSRIIVHAEVSGYESTLAKVINMGKESAVAVSPQTDLNGVNTSRRYLVMGYTPGMAGAKFQDETYSRVKILKDQGVSEIGVDGGVGFDQLQGLKGAGANWIISGNALFSKGEPAKFLDSCAKLFN